MLQYQATRGQPRLPTTSDPDAVLNTEVDEGIGWSDIGSCEVSGLFDRALSQGKRLNMPPQAKMPSQSVNSVPYMTMPSVSIVVPNTSHMLATIDHPHTSLRLTDG